MKNINVVVISLWCILFSSNANAWFFILPGFVTSKIADVVTGSEGDNCVGPNAKVGDLFYPNGVAMTIKSLSGTSSRCTNPAMPIRALLVPVTAPPPTPSTASTTSSQENTAEANRDAEAKSKLKDDEKKRIAADIEAARVLEEETKRSTEAKRIATLPPPVDFNAEALKASRILGCSASEAKVVGAEKENILYSITCRDSAPLQLSCDPSGLCLQKKIGN